MPAKKTKHVYPVPSTAEMVRVAMAKHNVSQQEVRTLCNLEAGAFPDWMSGRRKPPSPAFCNGFRELFAALPSIDREKFLKAFLAEYKLPVPNPLTIEKEKKNETVER